MPEGDVGNLVYPRNLFIMLRNTATTNHNARTPGNNCHVTWSRAGIRRTATAIIITPMTCIAGGGTEVEGRLVTHCCLRSRTRIRSPAVSASTGPHNARSSVVDQGLMGAPLTRRGSSPAMSERRDSP
jgi:hypothetical protein